MAIDDLTEEAFFEAYRKNPQVKSLVDGVQKEHHAHSSQKDQPGYDPGNTQWVKEAKSMVAELLAQQKQSSKEKTASTAVFPDRMQYAAGLAAVLLAVALASLGMSPYIPPLVY